MGSYPNQWVWSDPVELLQGLLDRGGLVGFPTESSYAIGADPTSSKGVEAVFRSKRREPEKPLPVVLGNLDQLRSLGGDPDHSVLRRVERLWPAPLTVVVPIARPLAATCGSKWLAVRVPAHDKLRHLLTRLGRTLTSTSANLSGHEPVSDPEMLREILGNEPNLIIDDGLLPGGQPSTIIKLESDAIAILRTGAYPTDQLGDALMMPVFSAGVAEIPADDSLEAR